MMKKVITVFRSFEGYDESFFLSYLQDLSSRNEIEFVNFDDSTYIQFHAEHVKSRIARRLIRNEQKKLFNEHLKKYIRLFKPSIFIFFKAHFLEVSTVELAKDYGAQIFAIYPDLEPEVHGEDYLKILGLVDLLIHTKPNLGSYFQTLNKNTICVNPFFSERNLKEIEAFNPEIGISFIGHHSRGKQKIMEAIHENIDENLVIYGDRWVKEWPKKAKLQLRESVYGPPVYKVYQQSLFVLGLLTEKLEDFKDGDVITARTAQIPAYGGLILHPRNSYSERFFGENHFMLFRNIEEIRGIHHSLRKDSSLREQLFKEQQAIILNKATSIENLLNAIINDEKSNFNYFDIFK